MISIQLHTCFFTCKLDAAKASIQDRTPPPMNQYNSSIYLYMYIYIYIPQGTMSSETSALSCPQVRSPQIINGNFLESNCFLCHRWETSLTLFIIFYNQPWPACSSTLHLGDFHRSSGPRAGICYGRNSIHCIYRLWPDVPGNPFHHLFFHNLPYRKI